jgi:hypothetical protein
MDWLIRCGGNLLSTSGMADVRLSSSFSSSSWFPFAANISPKEFPLPFNFPSFAVSPPPSLSSFSPLVLDAAATLPKPAKALVVYDPNPAPGFGVLPRETGLEGPARLDVKNGDGMLEYEAKPGDENDF